MAHKLFIHPENPQVRLVKQVVDCLASSGLIVLPTDSGYALATTIDNKKAQDKMITIKQTDESHLFSLLCADLSAISQYARVDNSCYRLLKSVLPGGYTFILKASQLLPRRLLQNKRKTIGIRVPDYPITQAILNEIDEPLVVSSLILPDTEDFQNDMDAIYQQIQHQIGLFVDSGFVAVEPTSVIDLSEGFPATIIREGQGDISLFE